MKNRILLFLSVVILAYACGSSKIEESVTFNSKEPVAAVERPDKIYKSPDDIEGIDDIVSKKEAQFTSGVQIGFIMDYLASDELEGRDTGSEGIAKAADLIEAIFVKNGVQPYFESYRDTLSNYNDGIAYNMVGVVDGNDSILKNEYIIVGAHYDHLGRIEVGNAQSGQNGEQGENGEQVGNREQGENAENMGRGEDGDDIANGANDNASGTTTVLELARYFGNSQSNKRSIIFALFTAEEKGLVGSRHLAQKLKQEGMDLYTVLNYEMTGVPLVDKDFLVGLTGYEMSNMAEVANGYSDETYVGLIPKAKELNLFKRSDNFPFHEIFGVPSQTFFTFDFTNFDHYHQVGDETSEMDYEHMANVVNKSVPVVEGIANAASKEIKYN
ncbi:MAG: M20/M25/M40 family metallo-hydrolase [Pricia sp.]